MAKFSRPTIQPLVKPSDLKKAIVEKNKKLSESAKILKEEIKSLKSTKKQAEKDLRSIQGDCEDTFNELDSVNKELSAVKKKSLSSKKKLDERLLAERISKSSCIKLESSIVDLKIESEDLSSKIAEFKVQEGKSKELCDTIESLDKSIKSSTCELAELKTKKSKFKKQAANASKEYNKMIKDKDTLEELLNKSSESFKAELKVIDKKLSISRIQCEKDISALNDCVIEKNLKLDEVDVMISKAESEYLDWEKKINVAKNNVLEEEDKIETIKKNFKDWQVSAVEEVARMKLKGRIENIDKAGLKDVLSR